MSPRQYIPFSYNVDNIPLIIYPVKDENPLQEIFKNKEEIKSHLDKLYQNNSFLNVGQYHILFIWNLEGKRMTDVWIHKVNEWSDSGPILECYTFRELEQTDDAGIASGDSIITLGREEELRRKVNDIEEYVDRGKYLPEFPIGFRPDVEFN